MSIENGPISSGDIWSGMDDSPVDILTGAQSTSGYSVTVHNSLQHHAVWRAVRMVSADVAKTALHVYLRDGDSRQRDREHPASVLIKRRPNDAMTAYHFWQCITLNVLIYGNGYAYISRGPRGEPMELLPLATPHTHPVRMNGKLMYIFDGDKQNEISILPEEILHFRYMTMDGIIGLSPLHYARNVFGLGLAAHKWQSVFFKNGAKMSVILMHPGTMKDETVTKVKQRFSELYAGTDNAHQVAVLREGMTASPFSVNPKDSQVIELLQANVKEVANIFGVPATRLGDATATSYSSLEQEDKVYLSSGLDPVLVSIESELDAKLVTDPDTHFIEFDRSSWLRPDAQIQGEFYNKALAGTPWMSVNQVRALSNMPPFADPKFNEPILPTNNFDPGDSEPEPPAAQSSSALRAGVVALISDATTRAFKRCSKQFKPGEANREKMEPALDADFGSLAELLAQFDGSDPGHVRESMKDAVFSSVCEYAAAVESAPKRKNTALTEALLELQETMKGICNEQTIHV